VNRYDIPYVRIFEPTVIINIDNIEFGKYIIIDSFVLIQAKKKIILGDHVHIPSFSSISGGGSLIMDNFSGLSSGVRIFTGSDDFKDWGFGNPTIDQGFRNVKIGEVIIGKYAIVGANSVILPDVEIGEGASVGAGSVVTKNLEPWSIYIGNKKIGERKKEEVLKKYEEFLNTAESERIGPYFKSKSI
jgi:acetyltransferase-like isoleucine patch superfamily enzyme